MRLPRGTRFENGSINAKGAFQCLLYIGSLAFQFGLLMETRPSKDDFPTQKDKPASVQFCNLY